MDLTELAAKETTALVERLGRDIADLTGRLAIAAAADRKAAVDRVAAEAQTAAETLRAEIQSRTNDLTTVSTALSEANSQVAQLQADVEEARASLQATEALLDTVRIDLSEARSRQAALERERDRAVAARDAESAARSEAEASLAREISARTEAQAALNREVSARTEAQAALNREVSARTEAQAALNREVSARKEAITARDREMTARTEALAALERATGARSEAIATRDREMAARAEVLAALDREVSARNEAMAARDREMAARLEAVAALDRETAARTIAETELQDLREIIQEHERARLDIEARLEAAVDRDNVAATLLDGLTAGFTTLASATTIPDVLTTLVEQLAAEFPRIALFRPKGNRLEGQHQIGFDLNTDITKVVMPLGLDSLPSRAAASGRIESLNGPEVATGNMAPFGGSPTCAVALPVVVQGETLAVLYADDWGNDRQDSVAERAARIKYCDAMLQHAVALLMRLTNELKTMNELRAYAASLLNEIQQMYVADVGGGKTGEELRRSLQANIEYARSIFATRVALECPEAGTLLEDEIAVTIEREAGSPFGRDLDAVARTRAQEKKRA